MRHRYNNWPRSLLAILVLTSQLSTTPEPRAVADSSSSATFNTVLFLPLLTHREEAVDTSRQPTGAHHAHITDTLAYYSLPLTHRHDDSVYHNGTHHAYHARAPPLAI